MARTTQFAPEEFYHLYNRGTEKRNIFNSHADRERFLASLYLCNQEKPADLKLQGRTLLEKLTPRQSGRFYTVDTRCLQDFSVLSFGYMGYREPTADSFVHVYNRGVKKMPIFRTENDLRRLLYSLFYFNTVHSMPDNWTRDVTKEGGLSSLVWPEHWEPRSPLVSILAFTIMPNHFHLVLKEAAERGISKFMHRLSMGYSKFINEKYSESGSLFQGTYKSRCIDDDIDLKNLLVYITVKNPFETYPGGLADACREFDRAYSAALANPLTSLAEYSDCRHLVSTKILDHVLLDEVCEDRESFKEFARDCMQYRLEQLNNYDF